MAKKKVVKKEEKIIKGAKGVGSIPQEPKNIIENLSKKPKFKE